MNTVHGISLVASVVLLATGALAETASNGVVHTWTSTSGQTVEASFVSLKSGYVNLRTTDGSENTTGKLSMLRKSDD